jgi:Histidine kinase-, DNA gyrase B-, and HSP90-like ATPase
VAFRQCYDVLNQPLIFSRLTHHVLLLRNSFWPIKQPKHVHFSDFLLNENSSLSSTTKSKGMGLGLAICRMIIERHAGKLSVSSSVRSGAVFRFILPTRTTAAEPNPEDREAAT